MSEICETSTIFPLDIINIVVGIMILPDFMAIPVNIIILAKVRKVLMEGCQKLGS